MNIACVLRWRVALVGGILYQEWLTLYGTTFQVQVYTSGWRSVEVMIMKKAACGIDKSFCKNY